MVSNGAKIDILTWDGTLSSSDFCAAALAFTEKWKRFNSTTLSQWSWVPCLKCPWIAAHEAEGYLSLENVFLPRSGEEEHDEQSQTVHDDLSCSGQDDDIDNAILHSCRLVVWVDHENICSFPSRDDDNKDGQPLVLDDIEKDLPANSAKVLMESKWTFITQEEHPYLNRPWHTLHPCGTSEWMKLLFITDASQAKGGVAFEKYLVSWLSVVGQVVRLRIPFEMLSDSGQL
ncbi:ubiquitin-like-conjugating enzyme ATG10 isoform X4 [Camellia sinensis]|uniref:ubiquitin-like-conjugating enzyme ATG10 isoform X4 n=1 Tax=Camellia sinensis TaxID=4442 RepID=UPI0010368CC1|nr:ubiquitin-like-conjugating enzyme ATG10 isoform X4 [Camellia sinensis]XP_028070097.1 ubiquitin-like-conjugating enzyme ATG10 isoform X4 [Camellia sinensis]